MSERKTEIRRESEGGKTKQRKTEVIKFRGVETKSNKVRGERAGVQTFGGKTERERKGGEGERERERERGSGRERKGERERERKGGRERERERE
uniref:Uncharacterized protein n=1 Tax=Octopus bimaculoides TaxID=37653 RepID=A0A0L8IGP7_OCTBM